MRWTSPVPKLYLAMAMAMLCQTPFAHAGWMGLPVTGSLTAGGGLQLTGPFSSPATVGDGVEFSGVVRMPVFSQNWSVTTDISDDSLVVTMDVDQLGGNVFNDDFATPLASLSFDGLTDAAGLHLTSYTCSTPFTCSIAGGSPFIVDFVATDSGMSVSFPVLRQGDVYVFGLGNALPEPASLGLLALALAGMGAGSRRRRPGR